VPDNDYAGLVERRRGDVLRTGKIVDEKGREVGRHEGQHRFTIGQRRGLSLSLGHPVYVVGKDVGSNTVTVGPKEALLVRSCVAREANWLVDEPERGAWRGCWAKYRYNTPAARGRVRVMEDASGDTPSGRRGAFEVEFEEAQVAVAPGQAVVLYDEVEADRVLGGGWIWTCERAR
jgi:tRNA-specific 2-thiouridylase